MLERVRNAKTAASETALAYQSGFGNEFQSEAVAGALPVGRNSPQRAPLGLYAEQLSGTAFTAPRHANRRTWTYRIQPSVTHKPYERIKNGHIRSAPFNEVEATPSQLRWSPMPIPKKPTDFVDGIRHRRRQWRCGGADRHGGASLCRQPLDARPHLLQCRRRDADPAAARARACSSPSSAFSNAPPARSPCIPRGIRFRVELPDGPARGYICENYGQPFRLPELGPIGANGLANARDFQAPVAASRIPRVPVS